MIGSKLKEYVIHLMLSDLLVHTSLFHGLIEIQMG